MKKLLVFTDLDGSLLNHHDYSWLNATPALNVLESLSCPVILNSSKTVEEMSKLRDELNNHHPFISENGSIVSIPEAYFPACSEKSIDNTALDTHNFGIPYEDIVDELQGLRQEYGFQFKGFSDMDIDDLGAICSLSPMQASQAKQRQASEPIIWMDTEDALIRFKSCLQNKGLIVVAGGRFHHVMADADKGEALLWLKKQYQNARPEIEWITIGLGDSYNDARMLEVVDYPVLISNPANTQPNLAHLNNLFHPYSSGSKGWNEAVLGLVEKIL